jgi:hypothetical protein
MKSSIVFSLLLLASAGASGAQPNTAKYTPEIRGQLMNGKQPATLNVCLRQSGSEIRMCGYPDFAGRFLIPSSGPMHSVPAKEGADGKVASSPRRSSGRSSPSATSTHRSRATATSRASPLRRSKRPRPAS